MIHWQDKTTHRLQKATKRRRSFTALHLLLCRVYQNSSISRSMGRIFSSPAWIQHLRKLLECFQMLKKVHKIIQMLLSPQMGLKTAIHGIRSPLSNSNSLISTVNNIGSALVTLLSEMGPEHCWFIRHLYSIFFCLFVLFCPGFQSKRRSSFFFITTFPVAFPGVLLKG